MSDLEKQASTWVPPWQRPAANPTPEPPSDGGQKDLREAAEQAAARWSTPPTEPSDDVSPAEAAANDLVEAGDAPSDDDIDGCEVVVDDAQDGDTSQLGKVPASRSGADGGNAVDDGASQGGAAASRGGAEDGYMSAAGSRGGAEDGHVSAAGSRGGAEGGHVSAVGSRAGVGGDHMAASPDGQASAEVPGGAEGGHAEGGHAGEGGSAARKGRGKKAADGASLKDGFAVAEMLAKALPEQRTKPRKADAELEAEDEAEEAEEPESYREFEPGEFKAALEAILMVVDEPVSELVLATVLEVRAEDVANALIDLSASYTQEGRGFDLRRAAGGWRFYTRGEYASHVERFVLDGQQLRLTQASLETLAVVAYKQPVTRARISAIRGVNCDGVIRTLITRGMVEECGADPDSGGHLYKTTTLFLEKMGLDSVEQLPPLAPFLPDNLEELANGE